jgi:hypothetical protein
MTQQEAAPAPVNSAQHASRNKKQPQHLSTVHNTHCASGRKVPATNTSGRQDHQKESAGAEGPATSTLQEKLDMDSKDKQLAPGTMWRVIVTAADRASVEGSWQRGPAGDKQEAGRQPERAGDIFRRSYSTNKILRAGFELATQTTYYQKTAALAGVLVATHQTG